MHNKSEIIQAASKLNIPCSDEKTEIYIAWKD